MYSKIRETTSFSHSDDSDSCSDMQEGTDSDTDTNTTSDYDSPTAASSSQKNDSRHKGKQTVQRRAIQISRTEIPSKHTIIKPSRDDIANELSHARRKNGKERKNKFHKSSSYEYTYETIIGIHLFKTSTLKFKKYIRAPRVKVSIFDVKDRSLVKKSDANRNVVINLEPAHVDYILPIISKEGRLNEDGSFSFTYDENLIINEDIHHIRDDNIVIMFELMDTVVTNFKTRWKMRSSDGWHHICWGFYKLKSSSESFLNKRRTLQLYKYRKSKRNASILEHWSDDNRKKYPGTLEVAIKEVKYQKEEVELSRPHTALQKDKHNSEVSAQHRNTLTKNTTLEQDNEGNFIIAGTSKKNGVEFKTKAEKMLPLIKFRNFFRWRVKFECPTQEMIRKQLPSRCLVCRFSRDGSLLAYTVEQNDEVAATDIVIAQVPSLVQQYILKGHTSMVNSLQWIPSATTYAQRVDKQVLLSSSEDHTCILWFLANEGNYSLEVLPHSCPILGADFLHTAGVNRHFSNDGSLTIASGGYNAIIYIWRLDIMDSKTTLGNNVKLQSPKADSVQCQRQAHLQQEISMHDAYIVSIASSREFPRMYTGDKDGTVLEWCEETLPDGEIGSTTWINSRSFRLASTLRSLQIVDKLSQGGSVLYASTTASTSSGRGDSTGTLYKIDTRSGYHCEITARSLPTSMMKLTRFNFVLTNCCTGDASYVLFTSDANKITCLNLKSDTEEETIEINPTRTSSSANTKVKHSTVGCIKTIDFTISSTANESARSILAVSLSSTKQLHGNFIVLYGSGASQHSSKTADLSTRHNQDYRSTGHGYDANNMRYNTTNSYSSSDCKNVSRLTSFFNEMLDKCDRIIRHGSNATIGYKLAQVDDGNSAMGANGNDDPDSDRTSIKSNGTFTIDNLSVSSDNRFGNTFSIDEKNEQKKNSSEANNNTFVIEKPKPVGGRSSHVDDTDVSEDTEFDN